MTADRVLVVGWDGAEPSLIGPLMRSGQLPNLAKIAQQGFFTRLLSTPIPNSLAAWTSAMTGVNPGQHGLLNFVHRQPNAYRLRLVNASDRRVVSVFRLLSQANKRVAALGIPGTYPPEPLQGVMIAGFDSPLATQANRQAIYPAEVYDQLARLDLIWPYGGLDELAVTSGWHKPALQRLLENVEHKTLIAQRLIERDDFDLVWIVFSESDTVGHHFWAFCDPASPRYQSNRKLAPALTSIYQALDRALGRLLETYPADSVLVMSDHGFMGASDRVVYINRILHQQGLLSLRAVGLVPKLAAWVEKQAAQSVPQRIKQAILRSRLGHLALTTDGLARFGTINAERTLAFCDELPQTPGVWIQADPQKRAAIREQVAAVLLAARDPQGRPLVSRVVQREDAFAGPVVEHAPDLLLELATIAGYRILAGNSGNEHSPTTRTLNQSEWIGSKGLGTSGVHTAYGLLVGAGSAWATPPATKMIRCQIEDVAATILALFGQAIPTWMEGRSVPWVRSCKPMSSLAEVGPDVRPLVYDPIEEASVRKRLEELGYL